MLHWGEQIAPGRAGKAGPTAEAGAQPVHGVQLEALSHVVQVPGGAGNGRQRPGEPARTGRRRRHSRLGAAWACCGRGVRPTQPVPRAAAWELLPARRPSALPRCAAPPAGSAAAAWLPCSQPWRPPEPEARAGAIARHHDNGRVGVAAADERVEVLLLVGAHLGWGQAQSQAQAGKLCRGGGRRAQGAGGPGSRCWAAARRRAAPLQQARPGLPQAGGGAHLYIPRLQLGPAQGKQRGARQRSAAAGRGPQVDGWRRT